VEGEDRPGTNQRKSSLDQRKSPLGSELSLDRPVPISAPARRRLFADGALLLTAVVWGSTFVIVKAAVAELPLMTFLALRFTLAFATLAIVFRRDLAANWRRLTGPGLVMGLCLFTGFALQTTGLQFTQASRAGFITGLSVVFVPVLEAAITRKWPPTRAFAGVTLALAGLVLLFIVPALAQAVTPVEALQSGAVTGPTGRLLGDLLVLACALAFGCHIASTGHYASTRTRTYGEAGALAAVQLGVAALGYLAICAVQSTRGGAGIATLLPDGATWAHPFSLGTAAAIVMTGLLATAGAFLTQTAAQRLTPPTHTALIFATEPVFAAFFGRLALGERLGPWGLGGCLLILAGMLVAELPGRGTEKPAAGMRPS